MKNLPKYLSGEYGLLSGPLSKKAAGTRQLTEKERKGLLRQIWLQALQLLLVGFISMKKDQEIEKLNKKLYKSWVRESDLNADVQRLEAKLRTTETELKWARDRADSYYNRIMEQQVQNIVPRLEG